MKPTNILLTWFLTLLLGLVVITIITAEFGIAFLFTAVAAVLSLPYVILMSIVANKLQSFWALQGVHLVLTLLTAAIIAGMDEEFITELYWVVFLYFTGGFLVHAYWWFKVLPNKEKAEKTTSQELLHNKSKQLSLR